MRLLLRDAGGLFDGEMLLALEAIAQALTLYEGHDLVEEPGGFGGIVEPIKLRDAERLLVL